MSFWKGFEKRAAEITSAADLESATMAGFMEDPMGDLVGKEKYEVLKGGANFNPDNDAVDHAGARHQDHDTSHGRNNYPGGI